MAAQRGVLKHGMGSSGSGLKLLSVTVTSACRAHRKSLKRHSRGELPLKSAMHAGPGACVALQHANHNRHHLTETADGPPKGSMQVLPDGRSAGGRSLQVCSKPCLPACALQHSQQTACSHTRPMGRTNSVAGCRSTLHAPVTLLKWLHSRCGTPSPHQQQNALHPVSVHALQAPCTPTARRQSLLPRCETAAHPQPVQCMLSVEAPTSGSWRRRMC